MARAPSRVRAIDFWSARADDVQASMAAASSDDEESVRISVCGRTRTRGR
jgi:hypothetical protein